MDNTRTTRKQPRDFRKDEVSYIMGRWKASESCSLVGSGAVGKSNLIQHLSDPEILTVYLGERATHFTPIIIDPNLLGPLPTGEGSELFRCWAGYELMMHRLYMAFYPFDMLSEQDAEDFNEIYDTSFQDGQNLYMGLRYLELGLQVFFRNGHHIVFMFDEFEEMLRQMPLKFFLNLRGLRDTNKKYLSYLTFARAPMPYLVRANGVNPLNIEPFTELFTDNLLYVGPYNDLDARRMIISLMERNNVHYPESVISFILWATGGYAGLTRATFKLGDMLTGIDADSMLNDGIVRRMVTKRAVKEECRMIWASLTPEEQHVLKIAAGMAAFANTPENEEGLNMLRRKRLITRSAYDENLLQIQPPMFRAYIMTYPQELG